jgi:hypothetical protein
VIRDLARDEAIAIAKAYSHPTVELRHVLWGLVHVLGPAAPAEVPLATVKAFLQPEGSSYETPVVTPEAEAALAAIETEDDAKAAVLDIAKRLAAGGGPPPPGGGAEEGAAGGATGDGSPGGPAAGATPADEVGGSPATTAAKATAQRPRAPPPARRRPTRSWPSSTP